MTKISVVIPTYNEAGTIKNCILSLNSQTLTPSEIVVVDDGSVDHTWMVLEELESQNPKVHIYHQEHKGPGTARNYGVSKTTGDILVFLDADMTFDSKFLEHLTKPIIKKKCIGTDSQDEFLGNPTNFWALTWNIGRFAAAGKFGGNYREEIVPDKSNYGGIFRAILRRKFTEASGFEKSGDYTDDESLSKKLGTKSIVVKGAKFYHKNPDSFSEVWSRARWIGSGKNFTATKGKILLNLFRFFPLLSILKGLYIAIRFNYPSFIWFKVVYDTAVWTAILEKI